MREIEHTCLMERREMSAIFMKRVYADRTVHIVNRAFEKQVRHRFFKNVQNVVMTKVIRSHA